MGFTCGLVGLPNVGKTTIFNALTQAGAEEGIYPFTTIEPHHGVVTVPDERLETISKMIKTEKTVPTTLQFVDIAGLVKGASKGEGLGNKFLGHIREVDAIAHVVRCFEDPNIPHITEKIDPKSDIETIKTELMIADLETLERRRAKIDKQAKTRDHEARLEIGMIEKLIEALNNNRPALIVPLHNEEETHLVKSLNLHTTKPVLYVCNIKDPEDADNEHVRAVHAVAGEESAKAVELVAKLEEEILEIEDPEEQKAFLKEMNLEETGLNRMIRSGYELLDLITFYTVVGKEKRAWTVKRGTKAPQAAGKIHTDFEKGFIRAVVYSYDDLAQYKTENAIKDAGKQRLEGKEYIIQDGDIVHFRFNV